MKGLLKILKEIRQLNEQQKIKNIQKKELQDKINREEKLLNEQIKQCRNNGLYNISKAIEFIDLAREGANKQNYLFQQVWQQQQQPIANLTVAFDVPRLLALPWDNPQWNPYSSDNSYQPPIQGLAPGVLRIGELLLEQVDPPKKIPALVPIRDFSNKFPNFKPGHIAIFSRTAESRQAALSSIESIALRVISTFPIRKLKGIFIDPVSMGNTFPFKNLHKFIAGQKTYTRSDDIREQLRGLTEHIEQVLQNYLGNNYESIEAYNIAAKSVAEAYRYLFIADFPSGFDNHSWEDLKSILLNGSKAGVYVVLHIDRSLERPRNFDYRTFDDFCTVLDSIEEVNDLFELDLPNNLVFKDLFELKLLNNLTFKVKLDAPPQQKQYNKIIELVTDTAKKVNVETVSFSELYPQPEWSGDSRREMRAPIGLMGAMDKLEFWLGENEDNQLTSHGLLAGKTGSGKSYTLHAIIISLAMKYSPDELELYLLDFKEGVEFQIYVDPEKGENASEELNEDKALPHAKVISIESDREFGLSVLKYINQQIEERSIKFKSAGNLSKLQDYRDKTGEKMPRILVVIDEFQYLFQESDRITQNLNQIMDNITRQGRAFGIHLLIASQSPNVPNMSRGLYSQIDLRMAQQMDKSTATSVLAEGNTDAVDLLDKPGKVIYNKDYGKRNQNEIGQVANISSQERHKALLHIQSIKTSNNYQRREPLILFNGSRPTKLDHNRQLLQLSSMNHWLSLKEINKQIVKEPDWIVQETPGVAWLGEAMQIGNHTHAIFRRRPRSNMLLIGSSEEVIFGIIGGILISLIHCYQPQKAQFRIIDLSIPDDENHWTEMTINFRNAFQAYFPTVVAKRFAEPETKVVKSTTLLTQTYEEFERRLKQREQNPEQNPDELGQSLFFVYAVGGLNRAQNLRPVMGRRNEEPSEDAEKLLKLISQGSELGIHTILWLEDMKAFLKLTGDNRSWLTHFDLRVGLAMPKEDSRLLLGETYAQSLPRLRAYFHDDSATKGLEKFKPYAVPTEAEIAEYNRQFQKRSTP
ncbi:MAG: ATP-binding protein [Symploca sp. SIO1B1]|nr:ATP-binding protein [Symploca sp. SIO1B1]